MKLLWPWEYISEEGGTFKSWRFGSVTEVLLNQALSKENNGIVSINGIKVHALIFESAAAGYGNYARWDCINGWTTTFKQAQKMFPQGLHGQKHIYMEDEKC